MKPIGIYLHIPFCVQKCLYCDFVSYAGREHEIERYNTALQQEAAWYTQSGRLRDYHPTTLYVGGGTPSVAGAELERLFRAAPDWLRPEQFTETTIEVNPGTLRPGQLHRLRQLGFTRISIGVQSFHDAELRRLGRIHTSADARICFEDARRAGFENISLDLMFGIPGSTLATWEASLQAALTLQPEHLSVYNLTVEEGTPFWEQQQHGGLVLPDEEVQRAMYMHAITLLEAAGFDQYEISNFARPGLLCQHNLVYWHNAEYLGLGVNAHSYLHGCRYWNIPNLNEYIKLAAAEPFNPARPYPATVAGEERLDLTGRRGETVIMHLRLREGLNLHRFHESFGEDFEMLYASTLDKFTAFGLLEIRDGYVRLTREGLYLSNEIFQEFL